MNLPNKHLLSFLLILVCTFTAIGADANQNSGSSKEPRTRGPVRLGNFTFDSRKAGVSATMTETNITVALTIIVPQGDLKYKYDSPPMSALLVFPEGASTARLLSGSKVAAGGGGVHQFRRKALFAPNTNSFKLKQVHVLVDGAIHKFSVPQDP